VVNAVTRRQPEAKVTCVRLEIGALSGTVADSVRFCFELVTPGTNLEGATMEISEPPARCSCRECGAGFEPGDLLSLCRCGSADVEVLSGQDLRIVSVEFAS
jgi:hydrogenase nickel incorporation protein HypA/HybF